MWNGSENHDYKVKILENKKDKINYVFYPYDNPKIDTEEKIKAVVQMFANGSLRKQKVFNEWCVAEGRVFNKIDVVDNINDYRIREIGIGIDYGSVNPTTFVPVALAYNTSNQQWELLRLEIYYHDARKYEDNPTTEYYSNQLREFIFYLKQKYQNIPITEIVIDSEATHYCNRLDADNIPYSKAVKGSGSVDDGVQLLQSLVSKGYFTILRHNSITHFYNNGKCELSGKDEGILEFESYQYDRVNS